MFLSDLLNGIKAIFSGGKSDANALSLDGKVSFKRALLISVQHLLAMFVANVTPVMIVLATLSLNGTVIASKAISAAMLIAGISTAAQLLIGSRLPLIAGTSFTFMGVLCTIGLSYGGGEEGYYVVLGSVLLGGAISTVFALFVKWWGKLIKPIVPCIVVLSLGLNLFKSGATQFFGGQAVLDGFISGSVSAVPYYAYVLTAFGTLAVAILWQIFAKGTLKNLNIIVGLFVGYIICLFIPGMIDFSALKVNGISDVISFPSLVDFSKLRFEPVPVILTTVFFVMSTTEGIANANVVCLSVLKRDPTVREVGGTLVTTTACSTLGALFGTLPHTTYAQNVGIVTQTKEVNRFSLLPCAVMLILCSFFSIVANFLFTIPECVIGGTMILLFGSIAVVGMQTCADQGFSAKNVLVISVSVCLGFGMTLVDGFYVYLESVGLNYLSDILSNNVLTTFVLAFILSWVLPEDMDFKFKTKKNGNEKK